ncbi:hypothetical protein D3C74_335000 [compost metagenome]
MEDGASVEVGCRFSPVKHSGSAAGDHCRCVHGGAGQHGDECGFVHTSQGFSYGSKYSAMDRDRIYAGSGLRDSVVRLAV